ncbi:hypothetical protein MPC1_1920004 [Methylocella tundrae]|nr:hypothetical protein MPC1_1920004 [Methylocella tundrae]
MLFLCPDRLISTRRKTSIDGCASLRDGSSVPGSGAWNKAQRAAARRGDIEHIPIRSVRSDREEYAQAFEYGAIFDRSNDSIRSESAIDCPDRAANENAARVKDGAASSVIISRVVLGETLRRRRLFRRRSRWTLQIQPTG